MTTKLDRIAEISRNDAKVEFTSIYHLLNKELLLECHKKLDGNKATGLDGVTKKQYEENLDKNLEELENQLKSLAYVPNPAKRVYIPKGNGKQRPLGVINYEDKIVQLALKSLIEAVYEPRFLDCMYGFRPKRSCHDALKTVNWLIERKKVNWILDADIKGFYDHLNHEWLIKFLGVHIKDQRVIRLVKRFLKAGIMEDNQLNATEEGAIQGGNLSPVLSNIYMHYVLTLWFYKVFRKTCKGECYLVVYADDFLCMFQYENEARRFQKELKQRLEKYGLALEEEKSRLIEFGRFAGTAKNASKPATFDFLGFTHYCGKSKSGKFRVKRKTSKKKFRVKVKEFEEFMKKSRTVRVKQLTEKVNAKLRGHYQYYGITDNSKMMYKYYSCVQRILFKWLNRRSQKKSYTWEGFKDMQKYYPLCKPKIVHNIYVK